MLPMAESSTPLQLIAFMYRETAPEETRLVQRQLAVDSVLRSAFSDLDTARRELPKVTFAPSDDSVKRILSYSQLATSV